MRRGGTARRLERGAPERSRNRDVPSVPTRSKLALNRPSRKNSLHLGHGGCVDGRATWSCLGRRCALRDHLQSRGRPLRWHRPRRVRCPRSGAHVQTVADCQHTSVAIALGALDKLVIPSVQAAAAGVGVAMLLLCDIGLARRSLRKPRGYIKIGLGLGNDRAWLLPPAVGAGEALERLLTEHVVDSAAVPRLGLVDHARRDSDVTERVTALARRFVSLPPIEARLVKRLLRQVEWIYVRTKLRPGVPVLRSRDDAWRLPQGARHSHRQRLRCLSRSLAPTPTPSNQYVIRAFAHHEGFE